MLHFACSTEYFPFTLTLSLSRNDAVGKGGAHPTVQSRST